MFQGEVDSIEIPSHFKLCVCVGGGGGGFAIKGKLAHEVHPRLPTKKNPVMGLVSWYKINCTDICAKAMINLMMLIVLDLCLAGRKEKDGSICFWWRPCWQFWNSAYSWWSEISFHGLDGGCLLVLHMVDWLKWWQYLKFCFGWFWPTVKKGYGCYFFGSLLTSAAQVGWWGLLDPSGNLSIVKPTRAFLSSQLPCSLKLPVNIF